jgi:hypothetical protein
MIILFVIYTTFAFVAILAKKVQVKYSFVKA